MTQTTNSIFFGCGTTGDGSTVSIIRGGSFSYDVPLQPGTVTLHGHWFGSVFECDDPPFNNASGTVRVDFCTNDGSSVGQPLDILGTLGPITVTADDGFVEADFTIPVSTSDISYMGNFRVKLTTTQSGCDEGALDATVSDCYITMPDQALYSNLTAILR